MIFKMCKTRHEVEEYVEKIASLGRRSLFSLTATCSLPAQYPSHLGGSAGC